MDALPFRILSLSGGGIRGIFQAEFLKRLEKKWNKPILQQFDLIAGTSTGSIIAIAVALGIDIDTVIRLYHEKANKIFKAKLGYSIRQGGRYNQKILRKELQQVFNNKRLRDAKTRVIITATCIDQYCHRVFSSFSTPRSDDSQLLAVEVALASSAAPTYFDPVKPFPQERTYVDGGLWANSPSLVAILYANSYLNIPIKKIKLLSIGTGEFNKGVLRDHFTTMRVYSLRTVETIYELLTLSQQSASDDLTKIILGNDNFKKISPVFNEKIALDDVEKAIKKLPALAENEADQQVAEIINMFETKVISVVEDTGEASEHVFINQDLVQASGLTGFYPSRKYYAYRNECSSIDSYVNTAQKSLVMVSINLWTGLPFTNLCNVLRTKLENRDYKFTAVISLLNPFKADLIFAISPVLNRTKEQLYESIKDTINELIRFRSTLSLHAQKRLELRVHNTIPFGSAIIIDHGEKYGKIQIETKPYKAVLNDSFAFEISPQGSSGFYDNLVKGYEELIKDGNLIEEVGFNKKTKDQ